MEEKVFSFSEQHRIGQVGEKHLDDYFRSLNIEVRLATEVEQRSGIDRVFTHPLKESGFGGDSYSVEYKTDKQAHRTGNAFLETVSVDAPDRQLKGWIYTCQADRLFYYVSGAAQVYEIKPPVLRHEMPLLLNLFPLRRVKNQGWYTVGLLVPLGVLARISEEVIIVNEHKESREP